MKKLLHSIIIIQSALMGNFEPNQSMVFPRCGRMGPYAWFPLKQAAMTMAVTVLTAMVKIRNLIVNKNQVQV